MNINILLTNRSLSYRAGSEMWTYTMYEELSKYHNVDVYTVGKNSMLKHAPKYNENKKYDLAIINHRNCLIPLRENKNIKKKIFTSHGVLPKPEQPEFGADIYVGVSEETRDNIIKRCFKCGTIIRNAINTEIFKPTKPVNRELKNVLYMSNRKSSADVVREACKGLSLTEIGGGKPVSDPENYINNADLVIGLGRCVYESLSCNRNVIVFDRGNGDGFVNKQNIYEYRKNNCSGRNRKISFTPEMLRKEFDYYDPDLKMRDYILENNDVKLIAQKYLEL